MLEIVTGQTKEHLIFDKELNRYFHKDIYQDFLHLKQQASKDNIKLYVLSSFRSFEDQLRIWNLKASGQRDLLDDNGQPLDFKSLSKQQVLYSILRWSAIPGTSRHHFGTDLDIVDQASWPKGYEVELIPSEFDKGGHFYKLRKWFDQKLEEDNNCKFFRPYQRDQGGVSAEMWHLSHKDVSIQLSSYFTLSRFEDFLNAQNPDEFLLLEQIKENSKIIYERYIVNICD